MKRPFELVAEIQEKDAIIATMNEAHKVLMAEKDQLIRELCDEVEWLSEKARGFGPNRELLQRAREATQ